MKLVLLLSLAVFTAGAIGAGFAPSGGTQGIGNQGAATGNGSGSVTTGGGSVSPGAQFQGGGGGHQGGGGGNQTGGGFHGNGGTQNQGGFQNGGGNPGANRASGGNSAPSHPSSGNRSGGFQSGPSVVSPPRVVNPPTSVVPQAVSPGSVPPTGTTGSGFNNRRGAIGGATTNNVVPGRPRTSPKSRAVTTTPGIATDPAQTRVRTNATMGLGTMPAVRQHLLNQGQNFQTWTANRDLVFDQFHQQNAARIEDFQRNRTTQWNQLQGHSGDLVRMARERGADWQNYRRDLWRFRLDRANEIRDRVRNGCDDLFTFDWWCRQRGRNFFLGSHSPWWWWNGCSWNTASAFCGYGWGAPVYYDYGANVLVGDDVYVDGQDTGPSSAYAQEAMALANPPAADQEPMPSQPDQASEWQPFGVFALTQEEGGSAIMFLELAINKDGRISGALTNILTDDAEMVRGSVDRTTQKAAWHVGDKTNTVYETGVANLTLDVAPVLIHFGSQSTQTWLLVRMSSPDRTPTAAVPVVAPAPAP